MRGPDSISVRTESNRELIRSKSTSSRDDRYQLRSLMRAAGDLLVIPQETERRH